MTNKDSLLEISNFDREFVKSGQIRDTSEDLFENEKFRNNLNAFLMEIMQKNNEKEEKKIAQLEIKIKKYSENERKALNHLQN
jgi:hypothetical protein